MQDIIQDHRGNYHLQGNFIAVRSDSLWLVIPQEQVTKTDRLNTQIAANNAENEIYLALSGNMQLLSDIPKDRFLITTFMNDKAQWCWNEIRVLVNQQLNCFVIPDIIKSASTLVEWGVVLDNENKEYGFFCPSHQLTEQVIANHLST